MASGTVLVIDDDEDFRTSARAILEREGYRVIEAESGERGLRALLEEKPDVITVDVMMESSSEGYGVTHAVRFRDEYAAFRDIPIIMISTIATAPDQLFLRSAEMGLVNPDNYLPKPLDIPRFLQLVRLAVQKSQAAKVA